MQITKALPTSFAKALCSKVRLYGVDITVSGGNHSGNDIKYHFGLAEFQQMVLGGASFEDALIAYHGIKLKPKQVEALQIVEKSTKPWMIGHVAGVLASRLEQTTNKDFTAAAQLLLDELIGNNRETGGGGEGKKSLIIKLANLD